jgi:hypothetical protein
VVRWKDRGVARKQMFATLDLAREFKGGLATGTATRRLSSQTVADYFPPWLASYRGRTARGGDRRQGPQEPPRRRRARHQVLGTDGR